LHGIFLEESRSLPLLFGEKITFSCGMLLQQYSSLPQLLHFFPVCWIWAHKKKKKKDCFMLHSEKEIKAREIYDSGILKLNRSD
jgi:hypothetical protein